MYEHTREDCDLLIPAHQNRATIFELNVESYRRRAAVENKRGRGASQGTLANTTVNPSEYDRLSIPEQESESAPTLDDFPQTVIQRLNGVGSVDHPADLWRKTEERGQALPVPLPARHNRRIPLPPVFGKRPQRSSGGLHRRRCVDRPEIRSHR